MSSFIFQIKFSGFLVVTFFCELAVVFVGFSFKDRMYTLLEFEMAKSINSTEPGIMKTWNIMQREVCYFFLSAHIQIFKSLF